jgi:hypothetical protein
MASIREVDIWQSQYGDWRFCPSGAETGEEIFGAPRSATPEEIRHVWRMYETDQISWTAMQSWDIWGDPEDWD